MHIQPGRAPKGNAVHAWNVEYDYAGFRGHIQNPESGGCENILRIDCRRERIRMQVNNAFSCEYSFDELSIRLCDRWETGLLLYGRAELTSAGDDYADEFYVSAIRLDGGARLARPSLLNGIGNFETELFRRIAAVIEDDKTHIGRHAAELFASELEQCRQVDHDQARKIRQERIL